MADKLPYHRKYRPSSLVDYIGNEKLKRAAMAGLAGETKPQVILLEGASGCGKTTFARLLAKEYLCENRDATNGACGCCPSCKMIDEYIRTGDTGYLERVHEIDIADQSGKRDLDSVLELVSYPSFGGLWDVFIFDECHMATDAAQNRLLKITEEPPENKLFIFCTTDPQEMLNTLRNRCQLTLKVKKPTTRELGALLASICRKEDIPYDIKGVNFIASRSDLTIRTALANLEKVINEAKSAKYNAAVDVFEEVSETVIKDFYAKLLGVKVGEDRTNALGKAGGSIKRTRDVAGYISLLYSIKAQTQLNTFMENLIDFTKRGIYIINQVNVDGVTESELYMYRNLFGTFSVEQMAVLTARLNAIRKSSDIESELIMLGYTGLSIDLPKGVEDETKILSGIEPIKDEVTKERKEEQQNSAATDKKQQQDNVAKLSGLMEDATLNDLQSMFGLVDVVED